MARARLMTSGLYIIVWNGPDSGALRAAWNSSAAFFWSASYCAGGMSGRRDCAPAGPARRRALASAMAVRRNMAGSSEGRQAVRAPRLAFLPAAGDDCMIRLNDDR